jgi:hypothetical protein
MKPLVAQRRLKNFEAAACWRSVVQTHSLIAAAFMLLPAGSALAQTASVPKAKIDMAQASWRKLSQSEVDCVDKALRGRGSQIWQLIERGIGSGDASVARVRAGCSTQAKAPATKAPVAHAAVESPAASRAMQASRVAQMPAGRAPTREYWSVDGSTLKMAADGSARKFFYVQPDPKAEAAGAQRGDLFLEATWSDHGFTGTVHGLEGRCGRVPYRVDGTVRDSNRRLDMQGQRPRVDGNCTKVGTVLDALTFLSVDTATAVAAATPAARPAPAKPMVEHAASAMAAADHAAVAKTDAEDAAEFNAAPDKPPAERAAANKARPVRFVTAAVSEGKLAANEAVEEKASAETVVRVARAEAERARAEADQVRYEAERAIADAIASAAQAKWGVGFVQGLFSGLIGGATMLAAGAIVLLLLRRRRQAFVDDDVGEGQALRQA